MRIGRARGCGRAVVIRRSPVRGWSSPRAAAVWRWWPRSLVHPSARALRRRAMAGLTRAYPPAPATPARRHDHRRDDPGLLGRLVLAAVPRLGSELVPELIQGEFFVDTELPPGTHLDVTQRRLARLEKARRSSEGVTRSTPSSARRNEQGGIAGELRENIGQLTLSLAPPCPGSGRRADGASSGPTLDREGELAYRFGRPSYFSFRTPIEVEIRGLQPEPAGAARRRSGRAHAGGSQGCPTSSRRPRAGNPELQIRFDRERLAVSRPDRRAGRLRRPLQGPRRRSPPTSSARTGPSTSGCGPEEEFRDSVDDLRQPERAPDRHDRDPALGGGRRSRRSRARPRSAAPRASASP